MQTVKLDDGTEAEAYTSEEIEAQKLEAIEAYKAENPDKSAELADLQEKLRVADEALAKKNDGDKNFAALRKGKEEAETKLQEYIGKVPELINQSKKEVLEAVMQDHKNDMMKVLSGGDAELEKKIEYHYKRLGDVASTKEEITNKLKDAYVLSTKQEAPDGVSANIYGSGGVARLKINNASTKFSAEEKELGSKFGLTDKDLK